jgi:hypothetical protein
MGPPGRPWPFFCAGSLGVDVGLIIHARSTVLPSTEYRECGSVAHLQLVVNSQVKSSQVKSTPQVKSTQVKSSPQALASDMRTDRLMCAGEQSLLGSLKMRDP